MKTLMITVILMAAPAAFGQARTVDNFALDKYKHQRLAAEKDLRENYGKLGFPSPEELERRRQKDEDDKAALLDRLREERLERERIELERQQMAIEASRYQEAPPLVISDGQGYPYLPYVYEPQRRRRFGRNHRIDRYDGYRVTPVGIFGQGPQRPLPPLRRGSILPRRR